MSSKLPLICLIILVYITTSSVVHGQGLIVQFENGMLACSVTGNPPGVGIPSVPVNISSDGGNTNLARLVTVDLPIDPNVNCTLLPTSGRLQAPISIIRIPNFGEFMDERATRLLHLEDSSTEDKGEGRRTSWARVWGVEVAGLLGQVFSGSLLARKKKKNELFVLGSLVCVAVAVCIEVGGLGAGFAREVTEKAQNLAF
ncbi:hypothetical protein MTR67_040823 [Solanum verrucosum]|uniref:Uncharacterized protein n=1 Tax=Solanum verrucosum TaxID=315347 RepID=A0AAF0UJL7_SOLVR|nr:hypothetical protein MTR67_040807 [Solanum verrucosum]WMV47430.1 hypothetical protein MTR67_040815 [Solanum verrucosum]WMV47438.1 hypothetical protein MTR67_040823 [Solanum verrucosum]